MPHYESSLPLGGAPGCLVIFFIHLSSSPFHSLFGLGQPFQDPSPTHFIPTLSQNVTSLPKLLLRYWIPSIFFFFSFSMSKFLCYWLFTCPLSLRKLMFFSAPWSLSTLRLMLLVFPQGPSPPVFLCSVFFTSPTILWSVKVLPNLKPSQAFFSPIKWLFKPFPAYHLETKWRKPHNPEAYVRESSQDS